MTDNSMKVKVNRTQIIVWNEETKEVETFLVNGKLSNKDSKIWVDEGYKFIGKEHITDEFEVWVDDLLAIRIENKEEKGEVK